MSVFTTFYSAFGNRCPRCHNGRVFENNNPYNLKNGLTMKEKCPNCGLKYEREVGYFYGAMYMSYALQVGLFVILYFLNSIWWKLENLTILLIIIVLVISLFPITFRWSRILWIAFFTPFDKTLLKGKND